MRKLSSFFLGFIVLVAMAASASASTINYSTTGTLVLTSGSTTDPLGLGGEILTLTNSLDTNQVPVTSTPLPNGGLKDIYNTQVTIIGPSLTLVSSAAQVTLTWYPHPNSSLGQIDTIGLNATVKIAIFSGTFTSTIPITIPGATPSPLLNTPLPAGSVVTASVPLVGENATFDITNGTIQGIGPAGVPEPGTITMLSGGLVLVAGSFLRKRFTVKRS